GQAACVATRGIMFHQPVLGIEFKQAVAIRAYEQVPLFIFSQAIIPNISEVNGPRGTSTKLGEVVLGLGGQKNAIARCAYPQIIVVVYEQRRYRTIGKRR